MNTREHYLIAATSEMRMWWHELGEELGDVQVSVGFPSTRSLARRHQRIGECWSGDASSDGLPQIFISPVLAEEDALAVLVHETIHAFLPKGTGHRAPFKRCMRLIGLEGKATATVVGEDLRSRLNDLGRRLGGYPHAVLDPKTLERKKQGTRLLKVECVPCGYVVRVTRTPLETFGPPICPNCMESMTEGR